MYFQLFVGVLCLSLFCYSLLCVHSSFAIILKRKIKLVAVILLSNRCIVTINVLWLFLTVTWVGLQYVIVVLSDHSRSPDTSAYHKIIFLISQPKHMLWVLKRTVSMRRFFCAPKIYV